ncbi:hypothetical protein J3E07_001589 [Methanococcus voltae]|uniref:Uncharacterized protein n=1 Tax=Methanococcus voltae TaxID=2188 RepID=A0A8J7UTY2_METVO|nr:hypothetical protein [Methanococcus voltae]MBP2202148.1 hypothetical protein [Methanococcus voltae]
MKIKNINLSKKKILIGIIGFFLFLGIIGAFIPVDEPINDEVSSLDNGANNKNLGADANVLKYEILDIEVDGLNRATYKIMVDDRFITPEQLIAIGEAVVEHNKDNYVSFNNIFLHIYGPYDDYVSMVTVGLLSYSPYGDISRGFEADYEYSNFKFHDCEVTEEPEEVPSEYEYKVAGDYSKYLWNSYSNLENQHSSELEALERNNKWTEATDLRTKLYDENVETSRKYICNKYNITEEERSNIDMKVIIAHTFGPDIENPNDIITSNVKIEEVTFPDEYKFRY